MLLNIYRKTKLHVFTIGMIVVLALTASCAKTTSSTPHQEVWKYQTEGKITSTPLIYNGSIYFGSDDHKLYSIHAKTGKANWSYRADSPIRSNPQTHQDTVIFQSNAGTVYALNTASGERKWSFATNVQKGEQDEWDYYDSSAAIDNDTLYIGSANTRLYALNANTGAEMWQFKAVGAVKSTPIYDSTSVYFGDWEGYLYALDKQTGTLQWSYKTEPNGRHKAIQSTPALYDGVIYLGARNFKLYAFQASSGKKIWELSEPAWAASPIYKDGVLYVGNSNGYFMQAVDSKSGTEIWRFQTSSNVLSAPTLEKGLLYFGSGYAYNDSHKEESIYVLDAKTGKLAWKTRSDKVHSTPALDNGFVYYTSFDRALHAIK